MNKLNKKAAKGEVNEADIDKERISFTKFTKKTEKLLSFCFALLLNLAEDLNIERKMVKRKIVQLLVEMMDRNNLDLLYSVLNFLKKLSIFSENERQMVQYKVVDKLNKFIPNPNQQLVNIILRLTLNLSFDVEFCDQLAETPLLKKIVEMLKVGQMRSHGISIL